MTPALCKCARILLGWSREDLAREAGVSLRSVKSYETGHGAPRACKAMQAALESAGIDFLGTRGLLLI